MADHSILLARRPDALDLFHWDAMIPSVFIPFGNFGEVCIQLRNFNQLLRSRITTTDGNLPPSSLCDSP